MLEIIPSSTAPVTVTLELPADVAEEVQRMQMEDPELLRRILLYGFRQKVIIESLATSGAF